jgi:hypothetical protein
MRYDHVLYAEYVIPDEVNQLIHIYQEGGF